MLVEYFEQPSQKSVGAEHARRGYLHRRDAVFMRDRFHRLRRGFRFRNYQRAGLLWRTRVTNAHRNRFVYRRLNRFGMKHFCAEVCELGSLLIRKHRYRSRLRDDPWISRQHAADIGPDLNLARSQCGADNRG